MADAPTLADRIQWAIDQGIEKGLTLNCFAVWRHVVWKAGAPLYHCTQGRTEMAREIGCGKTALAQALGVLVGAGMVDCQRQFARPNIYRPDYASFFQLTGFRANAESGELRNPTPIEPDFGSTVDRISAPIEPLSRIQTGINGKVNKKETKTVFVFPKIFQDRAVQRRWEDGRLTLDWLVQMLSFNTADFQAITEEEITAWREYTNGIDNGTGE